MNKASIRAGMTAGTRSGERGVVLILTLLVVLITYALVTQLILSSTVAYQTVKNVADRVRMEAACRSVAHEILDQLANDGTEGGDGGAMAGAAAGGLGGAGGSGDGGGEDGGGMSDGSEADSFEDGWAKPMRMVMNDIEIVTFVQDENSKMNLLALVSVDQEYRERARLRVIRVLDYLRDGLEEDLTLFDAEKITEEIITWLEGISRDEDTYPRPLRHSNLEEADTTLMFSLEELMMLESIDSELFYDQPVDDDMMALGLESVFTVWTNLKLDPIGAPRPIEASTGGAPGEDQGQGLPQSGSGFPGAGDTGGDSQAGATGQPGSQGMDALPTGFGVKININTAAEPMIRGLMDPGELPDGVVEEILRYRNEVDEDVLEDEQSEAEEDRELREALYGEKKDDPKRYFTSIEDLGEIESFDRMVSQENRRLFLDLVDVRSDVFSIYLVARIKPQDWSSENRYDEPPGPVLRMRSVVWRVQGQAGSSFIYLFPWHEVPHTRWRVLDFQRELPVYEAREF